MAISGAKQCGCQEIAAFYQLALQNPNSGIIASESVGPFNGLFAQYIVPTANGSVKITCNNGLDSLGFDRLSIVASGFVKSSQQGVSSGGRTYFATSIGPVSSDGNCKIKTLFSNANLMLPKSL